MISDERLSHLAHIIVDGIWNDDLVDYVDEDRAIRAGKRAVSQFKAELQEIERKVHQKIASLKRNVLEGTPEWDVMYTKYFEEELSRRGEG